MAENVMAGGRRRLWGALTDFQREQAPRLVLSVLSAAASGSSQGVAQVLSQAGAVSPALEEHVLWSAKRLLGALRLTVDPQGRLDRWLLEGEDVRRKASAQVTAQEGLFS